MTGAYRSMTRSPPRVSSGSLNVGMAPRMTNRIGGNASAKNTTIGSRKNSLVSVMVSRDRADMVASSGVDVAAGQRDIRVFQRGLLDPQVGHDDVVAGEHGGHGEQHVPGA